MNLRLDLLCLHKLDNIADTARDLYTISWRVDFTEQPVSGGIGILTVNVQDIGHTAATHNLHNTGIIHDLRHVTHQPYVIRLIDRDTLYFEF